MRKVAQLLERIGALQRSELRRFAQENGLQMVHLEVLSYLHHSNRYSDTTQALSEYLGQTKGSISQTIGFLEKEGHLTRRQDLKDKRVYHLIPSDEMRKLVEDFETRFYGDVDIKNVTEASLENLLFQLQSKNGMKGFGLCASCRHNSNPTGQMFVCGLTREKLSAEDIELRCREHDPLPK